uniref:Integrin_alpha2 domain-containing protein n=2 Tax=Macrostomum lignano TaxID=282301 RepID=A0A1I8I602_9PLAT
LSRPPTTSQVDLFNPGLATDRWLTERINRSTSGLINSPAVGPRQSVDIAWELPVAGAASSLTVTATFRHRLRLLLRRKLELHPLTASDSDGGGFAQDKLEYGELLLADEVQGINTVAVYNVSQSGTLIVQLTCLEDAHPVTPAHSRNNYAFSIGLNSVRYATDSPAQRINCRLGQLPCLIDNLPAQFILQMVEESPVTSVQLHPNPGRRHHIAMRCERRSALVAAAPGLLAALVSAPCALLLAVNAMLAARQCQLRLPGCQRSLQLCGDDTDEDGGRIAAVAPMEDKVRVNNKGRNLKRLGVRFQLD